MARIIFDRKERVLRRIGPYVKGHAESYTSLAKELDMSPQAVSQKVKRNNFTAGDLITIFEVLDTPEEDVLWLLGRIKRKGET